SAAINISTASLRQPPSAVAKKLIKDRLASCRTRSGTSSGRCVTRNCARRSVIMGLRLAPSTSRDDCATIPASQADGGEMELNLKGKAAVVTGASRGIGAGIARELAQEGVSVMLVARDEAALKARAEEIRTRHNVEARYISADLREDAAAAKVIGAAVQ